jgi:translation initiation factor IF-2
MCAFCAHRLGQARQPPHVQRRFLQSSRAASRPPVEGAAPSENNNKRPELQPGSWGRPVVGVGRGNGLGPGNGNAPAWGRGVVPGRGGISGGNWGRSDMGRIPARPGAQLTAPSQPAESLPVVELLPHEQRARDLMLERESKAQQRQVNIPMGLGPQATRSGRMQPRTAEEHAELAKSSLERTRAREAQGLQQSRRVEVLNGAPPIIRKISRSYDLNDGDLSSPGVSRRDNDQSDWGQLRRRPAIPLRGEEPTAARGSGFVDGRAQREVQSRWGRYTPLRPSSPQEASKNEYKPRSLEVNSKFGAVVNDRNSLPQRQGTNEFEVKYQPTKGSKLPEPMAKYTPIAFDAPPPVEPRFDYDDFGIVRYADRRTQEPGGSATKEVAMSDGYLAKKVVMPVNEEEGEVRQTREKKKKKTRRGKEENSAATYGKLAKGEDRDKARRRQQFVAEEDEEESELAQEEARLRAEARAERKREKALKKPVPIMLPEFITISNLAVALRVRHEELVAKMEELGFEEVNHDFILNSENAGLIAMEYNFEPIIDRGDSEDLKAMEVPEDTSSLPPRPPVVTIMGHVDHGKTTILDYLRKSSVAATEHGGITQHIGAFSVPMPSGKTITFLDTPGHAAFLSMRQRGATVTDIVILVVAADDSVMPQTIEAINHAKAAKVPIIVAVNKIDKEDSNVDKVKQDLARHGVDVEDYGGDTQVVCVSGKTGQGMDELEEAAVALSDILDMRADRECRAEGWVIEASIKSMGKCATVLVRSGTMRPGDFIVAGNTWARIRCLRNEAGLDIEEAGPGMPVEIDGWREQPLAGDEVLQAPDEAKAKSVVNYRLEKEERNRLAEDMEAINDSRKTESGRKTREKLEEEAAKQGVHLEMPEQKEGGPKEVYFIVKGDVSGSVEAVVDSISILGNKEVHPYVLRSGVGQVSEFDVEHASAAKGHIINFNTEVEPNIVQAAKAAKVKIIDQNIIYRLVDEVKAKLSEYLPPLITQKVLGEAEIAQIFSINFKGRKMKNIAGCKVRNGTIARNARVRVMRHGEKVFDGNSYISGILSKLLLRMI